MSNKENTLAALIDTLQKKVPEYLELLTATHQQDFDLAFDKMFERAVSHLESNSKKFSELDEEGLTAALAMALSVPGLSVTRETHSNGHVDLTVVAEYNFPQRKILGEAKVYDGPKKHVGGLEQLLGRYTTGREGRGIVIAYFRQKNISGLMQGVRDFMDSSKPANQQGVAADHSIKWSFISQHAHSCGDVVAVSHVGCNLFFNGLD